MSYAAASLFVFGPRGAGKPWWGPWLNLRAWIAYQDKPYTLSFWRTRSGTEVNFVLYGPEHCWAVEVKHTNKLRPADLRGLKSFLALRGMVPRA